MTAYPKRLIEVDLPIKRISAHARREKSIRHGHISTLHIWWARRPLAACRAVICASLWPDPADENCPQAFRDAAARLITAFAEKVYNTTSLHATASKESFGQWEGIVAARAKGIDLDPHDPAHLNKFRFALLDFIADFANWDNSTVREYLDTSRALTQAAHEAMGGAPGSRPLVVDPFAGGGSIPLEALRVGADAFASDLNPVAVLLNKVVLEYIPKYGQRLADEVRKWGDWIKREAVKELAKFYPKDPDGATPIAYIWARTIRCEGPGCGAEVPLVRSLWLAKKADRSVALRLVPNPRAKRVDFQIIINQRAGWVSQNDPKEIIADPKLDGTVKRGSATCPCCGYTTPVSRVREQLRERRGGNGDARLLAIVSARDEEQGRFYRLPVQADLRAARNAAEELKERNVAHSGALSLVPNEEISLNEIRRISVPIYGMTTWGDLFSPRQLLLLTTLARLVARIGDGRDGNVHPGLANAVQTILACAVDREAEHSTSLCRWNSTGQKLQATFGRQAIPMLWDFCETNVFGGSVGAWDNIMECALIPFETATFLANQGHAERATATEHPLPSDSAQALVTDPPYYDAVPYAYLSDFFYVWLRRSLGLVHTELLSWPLVQKEAEIVVDRPHELSDSSKDIAFYERELTKAFSDGRRLLQPSGVAVVVFASKTTASWEAILVAVVNAGLIITGSWPIDTELENRLAAQGQARLASSVHLVCRPREDSDGSVRTHEVGDWRDVLSELPGRIHDWMPRLASEGVVGADAIFACLGPALEIFSRYSRVEKANGDAVTLKEYLEHVWAAVSKEALSMIFKDADASGLEPDARLSAMWLWTLRTEADDKEVQEVENEDEEDEKAGKSPAKLGFVLEFDAARKIAQGLGANLEELRTVVEVKGQSARLLPVGERAVYLLGKPGLGIGSAPAKGSRKAKTGFLPGMEDVKKGKSRASDKGGDGDDIGAFGTGATTLDRIHQSMLLFARGRSDALKRFLVDDGIGKDARFWKLAQSLSALYPLGTDEKRWVDGVLARKKGLGL